MKIVLKYLAAYKKESILAPLFKMTEALFELLVPLVVARIINEGIANHDKAFVVKMCGVLILLSIVGLAFSITAQFFSAKAATGASSAMRQDVFSHVMGFSPEVAGRIGKDTLITRITSDINQVQSGINMVLRLFLRSPFVVVGALVMAFIVDAKSSVIFLAVIVILSVVVYLIMKVTLPGYKSIQKLLERVLSLVSENLEGARVIRAFSLEDSEKAEVNKRVETLYEKQIKIGAVSAYLNPVTYVAVNLGVIVLIYCSMNQVEKGILLSGEVVALVNYMNQILVELLKLANLIVLLMKAIPCATRLEELMAVESDTRDHESEADSVENADINVEDITFTYPGASEASLENVSFSIPAGSTFGIIGGTGSGKSTLLSLLLHDYDVDAGSVKISGKDIKHFSDEKISEIFGVVPQKAVLFTGTVRSNLSLKKDVSDAEMTEALKVAQAYDFVAQKDGLDTEVAVMGRNFSGGQRQRLTIARGVLGKPKVLLLDDAASALDLSTEAALRKELFSLSSKPSIVIVSQRASSVKSCNQILVLDDGKVAGLGSHEMLMKDCDIYQEIYYSQYPKDSVGEGVVNE